MTPRRQGGNEPPEGGQSDGPERGKENEQVDDDGAQRGRRGALQYLCLFLRADEQPADTGEQNALVATTRASRSPERIEFIVFSTLSHSM